LGHATTVEQIGHQRGNKNRLARARQTCHAQPYDRLELTRYHLRRTLYGTADPVYNIVYYHRSRP
jgi:hypothetical protein